MTVEQEKIKFEQIQAYRLYLEEGFSKVKELYPKQTDFVRKNQGKTFEEVEAIVMG